MIWKVKAMQTPMIDETEQKNLEKLEEIKDKEKRENIDYSPFERVKPHFRAMLSHYRKYPDLLLDLVRSPDALFTLTPFQRVYLRVLMRYKKVGIVATRGHSKTYIKILVKDVKSIIYP